MDGILSVPNHPYLLMGRQHASPCMTGMPAPHSIVVGKREKHGSKELNQDQRTEHDRLSRYHQRRHDLISAQEHG